LKKGHTPAAGAEEPEELLKKSAMMKASEYPKRRRVAVVLDEMLA
jgi:hypothetical protein